MPVTLKAPKAYYMSVNRPGSDKGQMPSSLVAQMGLPTKIGDVPVFYFWKEMIRCENYKSRNGKTELGVTPSRMDNWIKNFKRMDQLEIGVPIVRDHSMSSKDARGYVVKMERRGTSLWGLHQFIGQDALEEGARNRISIGVFPEYTTGEGQKLGEVLFHSSLTPDPVATAQQSLPIAASSGRQEGVVLLAATQLCQCGGNPMQISMEVTDEQLAAIRGLGAPEETGDEGLIPWLIGYIEEWKSEKASMSPEKTQQMSETIKRKDKKIKDLTTQLSNANSALPRLDERTGFLLAESARSRKKAAVEAGAITPAVADELEKLLIGDGDEVDTLMLSHVPEGGRAPVGMAVFDILAKNKPTPKPGTSTRTQVLSNSDRRIGDDNGQDAAAQQASEKALYDQTAGFADSTNRQKARA